MNFTERLRACLDSSNIDDPYRASVLLYNNAAKVLTVVEAADEWMAYFDGDGDGANDAELEDNLLQALRKALAALNKE